MSPELKMWVAYAIGLLTGILLWGTWKEWKQDNPYSVDRDRK